MSEKEFLEVVVKSKGKNGRMRFTKVGYATRSEYQGVESINIWLDKGIALTGGEGVFIEVKPERTESKPQRQREDAGGGGYGGEDDGDPFR